MISKTEEKKIQRKQKRCQHLITSDSGIECIDQLTENLVICNAGLSTGLKLETLLEELSKYGSVTDVVMLRDKSYCFVKCESVADAEMIYQMVHGKSKLAQNNGILYLSYSAKVPQIKNIWNQPLPPGLILLKDFVTSEEEQVLIDSIDWNENVEDPKTLLKHRQVKHYGYEFLYGANNVDANSPLDEKIPKTCDVIWEKLKKNCVEGLNEKQADQLTVNKYEPGQGIPPHCDTHSAFLDPIISLSLGSDIVMEFKKPSTSEREKQQHVSVLLPQRSLLIMSGESRYGWTHGITPRKVDVISTDNGKLTTMQRGHRMSFTFRWLKSDPCTCEFTPLCDTYQQTLEKNKSDANKNEILENPANLECENVHKIYDEIANHFSETRHTPWPHVEEFIQDFSAGSVLIDIGCGNGKYLNLNENIVKIGCDRSIGLLNVCRERCLNVFQCDCLAVPIRTASVDGCISIAVIHHLASKERRLQAINEMSRILITGGKALIYVWAKNQELVNKSSYLRQNKKNNKKTSDPDFDGNNQVDPNTQITKGLPVHTNRTQFASQDVLVPWKLKNGNNAQPDTKNSRNIEPAKTFLRYYHVFEENELEHLCAEVEKIKVIRSYYDQGNWCVIFEKL